MMRKLRIHFRSGRAEVVEAENWTRDDAPSFSGIRFILDGKSIRLVNLDTVEEIVDVTEDVHRHGPSGKEGATGPTKPAVQEGLQGVPATGELLVGRMMDSLRVLLGRMDDVLQGTWGIDEYRKARYEIAHIIEYFGGRY